MSDDKSEYEQQYKEAEKMFDKGMSLDDVLAATTKKTDESPTGSGEETAENSEDGDAAPTSEEKRDGHTGGEDAPAGEEKDGEGEEKPAAGPESGEVRSEIDRLKAENARLEKMARDNHVFARSESQRRSQIERELRKIRSRDSRPGVLDEIEGFEDGVRHVMETERGGDDNSQPGGAQQADPHEAWFQAVTFAHQDFVELSKDKEFYNRLQGKLDALGPDGFNPLYAIREITAYKLEKAEAQRGQEIETALREERARGKRAAQSVPTGGGGSASTGGRDGDAKRKYESMTLQELAAEADRVIMRE